MKYIVETTHTNEECLRELDEIMKEGKEVLDEFYWGCEKGDHTGYAIVEARNEVEARLLVPDFLRDKAKVVQVSQFTPDQIRSMH